MSFAPDNDRFVFEIRLSIQFNGVDFSPGYRPDDHFGHEWIYIASAIRFQDRWEFFPSGV
jgi:hypothetical protein